MFGIKNIKHFLRELRATRFILKNTDMVNNISRDRTFHEASSDAVNKYMTEAYTLLPRRYKLILSQLRELDLVSEAEHVLYEESAFNTLLGGRSMSISRDENGNAVGLTYSTVQNFPWFDDQTILEKIPESLLEKIKVLEIDMLDARKDEKGFCATLSYLGASAAQKDANKDLD